METICISRTCGAGGGDIQAIVKDNITGRSRGDLMFPRYVY